MNVLLLPNGRDHRADQSAERQIRRLGMTPVPLGVVTRIDAVVLVYGAEPVAYLAAGIYVGRKCPVAYFAPGCKSPGLAGEVMFIASSPAELCDWLDDVYSSGIEIGQAEPSAKYRRGE
ncbi:hypothetical protein GobsT_71560 [Gemmata obscuriglobus]|uniref:Uncharacterized protein n=1 Tax=Gemmata obscuriglobus TaxID=114 RepID=A0A2Z3HDE3_9BACT|nr:hypothetical protein [Gemmata obscuriglobus]AWM41746.1 hypothetical protein C1280_35280 [Gemmata obscuriglobus]QEG32303.1 hypothetical protein GobsT_71560 [Gemmata obscuriglobus]VTS11659.1 unnamed protein product [Gemmata obscuriglobus UQM 2246]